MLTRHKPPRYVRYLDTVKLKFPVNSTTEWLGVAGKVHVVTIGRRHVRLPWNGEAYTGISFTDAGIVADTVTGALMVHPACQAGGLFSRTPKAELGMPAGNLGEMLRNQSPTASVYVYHGGSHPIDFGVVCVEYAPSLVRIHAERLHTGQLPTITAAELRGILVGCAPDATMWVTGVDEQDTRLLTGATQASAHRTVLLSGERIHRPGQWMSRFITASQR